MRNVATRGAGFAIVFAAAMASCANEQKFPALYLVTDDSIRVFTPCAENVEVTWTSSENDVSATVSGDRVDGDCLGIGVVREVGSLGDRRVFVNGDEWVRTDEQCELVAFAAPGATDVPECSELRAEHSGEDI